MAPDTSRQAADHWHVTWPSSLFRCWISETGGTGGCYRKLEDTSEFLLCGFVQPVECWMNLSCEKWHWIWARALKTWVFCQTHSFRNTVLNQHEMGVALVFMRNSLSNEKTNAGMDMILSRREWIGRLCFAVAVMSYEWKVVWEGSAPVSTSSQERWYSKRTHSIQLNAQEYVTHTLNHDEC